MNDQFVRACSRDELPGPGEAIAVDVQDTPVAIIRDEDGELYALYDVCSHAEVPLSEGEIYDHTVECWLHGSCFDLCTGKPTNPPATQPVPTYRIQLEGDDVFVSLQRET